MNNSKLFIDFVEGNLDTVTEREFSSKMATDEEFRNEFRAFVNITNSINKNIKAFAPTQSATGEVFAKLGYSIPNAAATAPVAGVAAKTALFNAKIIGLIISGALSASLLIGLYYSNSEQKSVNSANSNQIINNEAYVAKSIPAIESVEGKSDDNIKPVKKIKSSKIGFNSKNINKQNIALNSTAPDNENIDVIETKPELLPIALEERKPARFDLFASEIHSSYNINTRTDLAKPGELIFNNFYETGKPLGLTLEIKNGFAWNSPKETISPAKTNVLKNTQIAIVYKLNSDFEVGADFRWETFYVTYTGNELGWNFKYAQQPNFQTYGLLARYKFIQSDDFNSSVQTNLAKNSFGIIGRSSLGCDYKLSEEISLTARIEYSKMFFNHQGKQFNAQKFDLIYGINYSF